MRIYSTNSGSGSVLSGVDRWAKQIYDVYRKVIERKRFGCRILGEHIDNPQHNSSFFGSLQFSANDTAYTMLVGSHRRGVSITVIENPVGRFQYKLQVDRRSTMRLRQQALILMRKIKDKPMYDIMKA